VSTKYRLEVKADWPDPAVPVEDEEQEAPEVDEVDPNTREWAGDEYAEGDEPDPLDSFGALTGSDGSEAWLERRDDGSLIGWVRDSRDDRVYRYTDAEAWAADVDGAGMNRVPGVGDAQAPESEPAEGDVPPDEDDEGDDFDFEDDEGHTSSVDDATEDEPELSDDEDLDPLDDPEPDELGGDEDDDDELVRDPGDLDDDLFDDLTDEDEDAEPEDDDETTDEDADQGTDELKADESDFFTRMKKKGEGKMLALRVRPL